MGWMFTIKSFIAVILMSTVSEFFADTITLDLPHPAYGRSSVRFWPVWGF